LTILAPKKSALPLCPVWRPRLVGPDLPVPLPRPVGRAERQRAAAGGQFAQRVSRHRRRPAAGERAEQLSGSRCRQLAHLLPSRFDRSTKKGAARLPEVEERSAARGRLVPHLCEEKSASLYVGSIEAHVRRLVKGIIGTRTSARRGSGSRSPVRARRSAPPHSLHVVRLRRGCAPTTRLERAQRERARVPI
jgi:hypothetical protein